MNKTQYILIGATLVLFMVLYFACETKPPGHEQIERSRTARTEAIDINTLIRAAHDELPSEQVSTLLALEQELDKALVDSVKIGLLQRISGTWYSNNQLALAGHYAQEVADLAQDDESWSIAATTYAICVQKSQNEKVRSFCNNRAVQAFENAISLDPDNVSSKVNLALTYTEMPPADNPMKGVLMLRDLQERYPQSALVLNSLARLALKTGQYAKAEERLLQALSVSPDNRNTICLLAQAYKALGRNAEAAKYDQRCRSSQG